MNQLTSNRNNRRFQRRSSNQSQRNSNLSAYNKMIQLLSNIDSKQTLQVRGVNSRVPDVFPMKLRRNKIYTVSKTNSYSLLTASTAADVLQAYAFTLANLPDAASYAVVFDNWRIAQATIRFEPGPSNTSGSILTSVIDYDDLNPVSLSGLLEYDTVLQTQPTQIHVRTLNPRVQTAVFIGGSPSPALAPEGLWLDMSTTNVPNFGVKIALPQVATAGPTYTVTADVVYQFRTTR